MRFSVKSVRLVLVLVLLVGLLLTGCNRSATRIRNTPEPVTIPGIEPAVTALPAETPAVGAEPTGDSGATLSADSGQTEPTVTEPEPAAGAEPAAPAVEQTVTVVAGDTLYNIALQYGVTIEELAARNNIVDVNTLEPGQVLVIPVPGTQPVTPTEPVVDYTGEQLHLVQAGENLFRIALRYGFSHETIAAYNNIPWPYTIYPGQEIRIPPSQ